MLLSVVPLASVAPLVWPDELAVALFLIFNVLPDVLSAIGPAECAFTVHLVRLPFAFVLSAVEPGVGALSVDVVVEEFTHVHGAVGPVKGSNSMLLTIFVVAFVLGVIGPSLDAVPVLLVLLPLSVVFGSIHVLVGSLAMSFVIEPLSIVTVAVRMNEPTQPIGLIVFPVAFVLAAVTPNLNASAFTLCILCPLAKVDSLVVQFERFPGDQVISRGVILIELEWPEPLLGHPGKVVRVVGHRLEFFGEGAISEVGFAPILVASRSWLGFSVGIVFLRIGPASQMPSDQGLDLDDLLLVLASFLERRLQILVFLLDAGLVLFELLLVGFLVLVVATHRFSSHAVSK